MEERGGGGGGGMTQEIGVVQLIVYMYVQPHSQVTLKMAWERDSPLTISSAPLMTPHTMFE